MATEAGSDSRCGIGARLRTARERAGLTVLQAAEKLHADAKILDALEAERFEELGAAVFVRGHIRRYADLVREPAAELQELYNASTHAGARPDLTNVPSTSKGSDPGKLLVPGLVMVIAVGTIGLVWWFLTELRTTVPPPAAVETDTAAEDGTPPGPDEKLAANGAAASTPKPAAAGSAETTTPVPEPEPPPPVEIPPPPRPTELTLRFASDSWVEVYDSAGNRLFYDVGSANSVKSVSGPPPLRVLVGNPEGVAIEVNGQSATVPTLGNQGSGVTFIINRAGRVVRPKRAPNIG